MIHAGNPVGVHRGFFLHGIFAPVALDLDHQIKRVSRAVAVVHLHDEIGPILAHLGAVAVWHLEAEVVVLDVGKHLRVRLRDAAKLALPVAVEDDPVEVTML